MKTQRIALALTVINLLILVTVLTHVGPAGARETAPMLRGRGLEIVDDSGKRRAQLIVVPPSNVAGKKYAETVLFRLIDPNGRPGVKIGSSVDGTAISLAGDSERREWSGIQILAESTGNVVKLTGKDGQVQQLGR